MERVFRLRSCSEDDTIYVQNIEISSEIAYRLSVGSTGAVFVINVKDLVLLRGLSCAGKAALY